jgi:signal transduction histidine kinase
MNGLMIFGRLFALAMVLLICGFVTHFLVSGIREREEKLYKMSKDLVALSHVKEEFFRRVTHDLKSPVAAMMSAIDAVLMITKDTLAEKPADMLKRIRIRGEGLLSLIKDLLEIAKLSTAAPLLKEVSDTEQFKAGERKITLTVDISGSPVVIAEDSSLREVFSNLVSNAVRYTPEGGTVRVKLEETGGKMRVEVADSGIGISEEDQKKLFTEFFRASNARKFTAAGTGLGLAITRAHVAAFGGTISVSSVLGEGTTFAVEIPLAPHEGKGTA